ncbi:hypothetical protein CDD81_6334 [Ophiocordyceps australis]|uniref:RING-type domain-containing protein n=1 Tax=Ophiocordyceps australis TaxID=1399860 RepID=A0A2C5X9I9_9HYPO|nr:hypothetical protein CDD81_6334 [Ophiocordyceps australis]
MATQPANVCKACDEALVIRVGDEEQGEEVTTVPDNVTLGCKCHYHWECLMEQASAMMASLKCPSCHTYLPDKPVLPSNSSPVPPPVLEASIYALYSNEGCHDENVDLLPSIKEEAYLQKNPEARPARALHVMCTEGDVQGMIEMLHDLDGQETDIGSILSYQDPLSNMKSGLHLALENGRQDVAWILLWMGSAADVNRFPVNVRQTAELMGLGRLDVHPRKDLRELKDGQGRLAQDVARQNPEVWTALLETGVLSL